MPSGTRQLSIRWVKRKSTVVWSAAQLAGAAFAAPSAISDSDTPTRYRAARVERVLDWSCAYMHCLLESAQAQSTRTGNSQCCAQRCEYRSSVANLAKYADFPRQTGQGPKRVNTRVPAQELHRRMTIL
jgi:hypothetical protein